MLGRCVLVEGVLDGDARGLESLDRPAADVGGLVVGGEVEVAGVVEGVRCSAAVVGGEVEELDLRCAHQLEAVVRGLGEVALEHLAGVAGERGAVELGDVTEDPGGEPVALGAGHELERVRVRAGRGRRSPAPG